jgi:hypothetical protein
MRPKVMGFLLFTLTLVLVLSGCVEKQSTEINKTSAASPAEKEQMGLLNQILSIVKDIQTNAGTILTTITSLQSDVTTIKTTTSTIDQKLQGTAEPIRYEYYTGRII